MPEFNARALTQAAAALRLDEANAAALTEHPDLYLNTDGTPLAGTRVYRSMTLERADDAVDEEARTVRLAFSSEAPYERWFGMEVLDHQTASVRMARLKDGAALLLQHDTDQHIGVVEAARIDASAGRGRATVRFGRGALAEEVFRDVVDGIRRHVSVGYIVHDMVLEARSGEDETYRVTDWEPLEISIVSVPADATVGVGRAAHQPPQVRQPQQEATTMPDIIRDDEREDELDTQARDAGDDTLDAADLDADHGEEITETRAEQRSPERQAVDAELRALGRRFRATALADEMIALEGSVEELRSALRRRAASQHVRAVPAARDVRIETPRYRAKALRAFAGQGEEAAYRAGMWAMAVIHDNPRARRWCRDHDVQMRVASSAAIGTGGAVVPDEMSMAIIDLREEYGVARRICDVVTMASDTQKIPRRTGGVTAYFVGDNTATTESDKSWDQVELVARELSALSRIPMSYVEDAAIDVAEDLAREMAYAFVEKEDDCLVNGDGTSTYGGIVGLRPKLVDGTHTVGAIDATSGTDTIPEVDGDDLDAVRAVLPAYADANAKWLVHKAFKNRVHDAITRAAGGNTMETLAGKPRPAYLGDEIVVSQKMPGALATNYNNLCMALYGDFEKGVTLGDRRGFVVQVLRERYAEYRQLGVIGWERFDIVAHDLGDTSVAGPIVGLIGAT